jgi:nucleoside-diphosphate-sugar epimerase
LAEQTGIRLVWVRVFSVYGPHDNPECMIPAVARKLLRRERPSLTAGEQLWDYLYAEDAAEAIYRVAATPGAEGVFNLGSGVARTIRQIVEQVRDLIDRSLPLGFGEVPYRPDQVMHLQADITRLRRVTGWTPQTAFAVGVARTVQWCRSLGESA